ncbi:MAG TPA: M48 family metalloprotease [Steroidobacteraceae bacterium]|nr:M48 family metalloprotease [Steroidobacteraceae bacterium]
MSYHSSSRRHSLIAWCAAAFVGFGPSMGYAAGVPLSAPLLEADATAAVADTADSAPRAVGTEGELPALGSAANAVISLQDEYIAGLIFTREMRQKGEILEDPEVSAYIQEIGHELASYAQEGQHQFSYHVIDDPTINSFAIPGGFIFVDSGLFLATSNESELAAVLAHETAHVTQRHIARRILDQEHAGLISTAAMLAAVLLGATAGGGSPGAMEGAVVATQGAAIQHELNYSRAEEAEADRIGIYTMASAGFDPLAMASFFQKLELGAGNPAFANAYGFLMDHPVTADRIAEARNRAAQIGRIHHVDSISYGLMRERLRSLVGDPQAAVKYYEDLRRNGGGRDLDDRYGLAVAYTYAHDAAPAIPILKRLLAENPRITQLYGALGQAYLGNNQPKRSQAILEKAHELFPLNVPVTIRLAQTYMREGLNARAHHILLQLFNVVEPTPAQTQLIARAAHAAGDVADSYYYMSEFYIMNGQLERSSGELRLALALPNLNPIQRARFSARLEEVRSAIDRNKKHEHGHSRSRSGRHSGDGGGGDGDGDGGH